MDIDTRNIIALVGVLFAIIGLSCSAGLYGKVQDLPDCCGTGNALLNPPAECQYGSHGIFGKNYCISGKSCDEQKGVVHDDCCYEMSANAGKSDLIFAGIVLGCIMFTGLMAEFSEKCPACAQNCSACILGTANLLGLAMVIMIAVFSFQKQQADDTTGGCADSVTLAQVTEAGGLQWSALIFIILAQLCSCVVAVMTSSCFQDQMK